MSERTDLVSLLEQLVGPELRILDPQDGWPAVAEVLSGDISLPTSLFVSRVGLSHRDRDDVERRFQNPASGRPMEINDDRFAVLAGVWTGDALLETAAPVIVLADPYRRADHRTRWSAFTSVEALVEGASLGWVTHISGSEELVHCVRPEMFALAVAALESGVDPDPDVLSALRATGLLSEDEVPPPFDEDRVRLRRTVSILARDATFRGDVLKAYGHRCAMCGLGLGLVQGAHVYPASAPGATDHPSNGVALCANHHLAFDRFEVAVLPRDLEIVFRPDILERAGSDEAIARFVDGTFATLASARGSQLDLDALELRHRYFAREYWWLQL